MKAPSLVIFLLLSSLFLPSLEKKLSKKDKKTLKLFNSLTKKAQKMQTTLVGLITRLEVANATAHGQASVSTRHDKGTDALTLVDASFIGNQCGSFTLGSWSETMNCYHATGVCSTPTSRPFTSGYFSPVVQGWYHICSFSRFKQGGNSNDVTIMVGGSVVAAYGSAVTSDWRTTGICFDTELTVGTLVNVKHQSGGSNDCIESTGWPYNKFIVHNTANN